MSALRELFAKFDVDTALAVVKLKSLDGAIGTAKKAFVELAATAAAGLTLNAAKNFIAEQIEIGSRINDTAEKLGVSTEELQKFQFAAGLSGVSAEGAATALQFLNKNLGEAANGNEAAAKTFAKLGIDVASVKNGTASASDLLPDLADKFASAGSDAERTALAMDIFGRSGAQMLPLLKQGSGELKKLAQEFYELGGGMDEGFIKMADKAGDEIDKLKFAFQGLKSRFAVDVLPHVTDFAMKLSHAIVWVRKLTKETYIVQEVLGTLGVVGALAAAKTALGWAKVFGLFPKGNAGLVKTLASMGALGAIIAAVAGLALVFEDLWIGINGGESAIRGWLEKANGVESTNALFENLKATADQIGKSFEGMMPALGSVAEQLGKILIDPYFVTTLEYCVRLLGSFLALVIGAARATGNLAKFAGNVVAGKLTDADKNLDDAGKAIDQAGNSVFGANGFFGANALKGTQLVTTPAAVADPSNDPSSPYYYQRGPAPSVTQTNTVNVTVQGGNTNSETGKAVGDAVRSQFEADKQAAAAALKRGT